VARQLEQELIKAHCAAGDPLVNINHGVVPSALKGRQSPTKGKTHSEETKLKIRETLTGKPSPNKGKLMSEEQKQKCRAAAQRRWARERAAKQQQQL